MLIGGDHEQGACASRVVILGIGWDANSSFCHGAAEAPDQIRAALHSPSTNLFSETGLDLGAHPELEDRGNLAVPEDENAIPMIEETIAGILEEGHRPLLLGGDHAITYPVLRAVGGCHTGLTVIHFDAHPDLYDDLDGNPFSHACPLARAMESGRVARLIQVGIRSTTRHQREQARRLGVETYEMRHHPWQFSLAFDGPLYLSIDLDVLDPAFAPGVSHIEPGGLSTRDLIAMLHNIKGPLVGADIVELNPRRDAAGRTGMVAAKILKEVAALMLAAGSPKAPGTLGS